VIGWSNGEDAVDYRTEYDDYWSRADRWGTNSFVNVEQVLVPLIGSCGKGRMLDIGCGMGRLVKTLWHHGVDAHGIDVSERVVRTHRATWPDRFHLGSATALPFPDGSFDTIVSCDCLEHLTPHDLEVVSRECARVSRGSVYLTVSTALDRDRRWHLTVRPRAWWEDLFVRAGFRRHPRMLAAVPFVGLETEPWQIPLVFERDPAGHEPHEGDWGTRSDREADAGLAFYTHAAAFVPARGRVIDWDCGAGFGSAVVAAKRPDATVVGWASGVDLAYAARHYGTTYRNLSFIEPPSGPDRPPAAVVIVGPRASSQGRSHRDVVADAAAALEPGGHMIVHAPATPAAARSGAATGTTWPCALDEWLWPETAGLSPRHAYALSWLEARELREIKLPVTDELPGADAWIVVYQKEVAGVAPTLGEAVRDKVVILAHHRSGDHFEAFLEQCPHPVDFVSSFGVDWTPPPDAGVVMSLETYDEPGVSALRRSVESGVPTLVLADGIVEYRNTWNHPQNVPGAMMQPVLGHKVACLGPAQARVLETWGNFGSCEVVGGPRFDAYLGIRRRVNADGPASVLVATAKTPYFTSAQRDLVVESLRDVRAFLAADAGSGAPAMEARWRVAAELEDVIGLADQDVRARDARVIDALAETDILVTTPSTLIVEGMLAGCSVVVLDYTNSPSYYNAAWRITAQRHISDALRRAARPTQAERLFQQHALHDLCACSTPATPRLLTLVRRMMESGRLARDAGVPLSLPVRMLPADVPEQALPDNAFDMTRLYPSASQARRNGIAALQYEVALLRRMVESRESDLNRFDQSLRNFEADVTARHTAVSAFEKDLLAYRDELDRKAAAVEVAAAAAAAWFRNDTSRLNVGHLMQGFVGHLAATRPVYCWGAGALGRRLMALLGPAADRVQVVIDGSAARPSTAFGKPVEGPGVLWAEHARKPYVLVAAGDAAPLTAQLDAHGYRAGADYACVPPVDERD